VTKDISLSIVIPAYNEQRHLKACLDSIANQTEKPDEVIVVDNNSTDKTFQIAAAYPFVKVLKEKKQGVVFARDRGFNAASSDIIGRIDADSILPSGWVHYVKRFYREPDHTTHCLTGGCYFYNMRLPHFQGWFQGQMAFRFNRLLMGHYILFGSNMAIPKTIWKHVKDAVCHDTDVHEDLDLAIHVHRAGYKIAYREGLKVGVKMRRVRSNREELLENQMWWPKTLKRHGKKTWIFGWLGAIFLYSVSPLGKFAEKIATFFGRPSIPE
jgi:glycosyltransferase involved in cell wall biosynthesis